MSEVLGVGGDVDRLRTVLGDAVSGSGGAGLDDSLGRIAESACEIVGCRYAAVIVRDQEGELSHFVPVGVEEGTQESVGRLPSDRGLIGEVIDDGRVLRVPDIAAEPGAVGLPEHHPEITDLIGVPIRAAGELTGGLFLSAPTDGREFDADAERTARAIATVAGFLVDRARSDAEAERSHRWLAGSTELTREIVAGVHADPMQVLVDRVLEVADADLAAVILPSADGTALIVTSAAGERADLLRHRVLERVGTMTDQMIRSGKPLIVDRMDDVPGNAGIVAALGIESALMVPMKDKSNRSGTLALFRYPARRRFVEGDLDMAGTFAAQMVLALELAEARADRERAALFAERERIARDLHDHVIQQLFAIGMNLQGTIGHIDPAVSPRVLGAIDDLDSTILQIRSTIYRLTGPVLAGGSTLRSRAEDLVHELTPLVGVPIGFDVRGPVDFGVREDVADDVIAVLREALTNVARHADATRVDVALAASPVATTLSVADNGCGIRGSLRRSGLANLRVRAEQHGGTMDIDSDAAGTRITWSVPSRR